MFTSRLASHPERYHLTSLLGEGGFARVYRARPSGATFDVAIKILTDPDPPDEVVRRFEDEARILGLAQDRALISVEPMARLGDHWAVVMEYVPGANCRELVEHHGPLPARVALQIVGEVARALDRVHHQPGPNGAALGLLHRDLKPSNLQVTHEGAVKVLDFGGARLDTSEVAQSRVHGTFGYIAPERLRGIETPAVDTYALGMVLFRLLTAEPTNRKQLAALAARMRGARGFGLRLAAEMCALESPDRPSLAEVTARCENLVSRMDGPTIEAWAATHVLPQPERTDDPLCGTVLGMGEPTAPPAPVRQAPRGRAWRTLLASVRRRMRSLPVVLALVLAGAGVWAAAYALGPAVSALRGTEAPASAGLQPTTDAVPATEP